MDNFVALNVWNCFLNANYCLDIFQHKLCQNPSCKIFGIVWLFLTHMKLMKGIREAVGARILHREMEPVRLRKGFNFNSADRIGLIYLDRDEKFFRDLNDYAKFLKENFGISQVQMLGFVDENDKKLPAWQQHRVDSTFIARKDLNWHFRPLNGIQNFVSDEFDILIDFSGGNILPLNFVLKESRAKMKVGLRGTRSERYCDFILNMGEQFGISNFVEQLNSYLSNPKIR